MLNISLKKNQLPEFMSHRKKYLGNRDTGTTEPQTGTAPAKPGQLEPLHCSGSAVVGCPVV